MENLGLGLTLMLIGMVTVFAILIIVIALSNALIRIVNKVCPAEEAPKKASARQATVDSAVMDVINATVAQITAGKGRVTKVERI